MSSSSASNRANFDKAENAEVLPSVAAKAM